jgi:hypothetical protein
MLTELVGLLPAEFSEFGVGATVPYLVDIGVSLAVAYQAQSAVVLHWVVLPADCLFGCVVIPVV